MAAGGFFEKKVSPLQMPPSCRKIPPLCHGIIQGGVVERFMAAVLKTAVGQPTVGSNPTPSAILATRLKSVD